MGEFLCPFSLSPIWNRIDIKDLVECPKTGREFRFAGNEFIGHGCIVCVKLAAWILFGAALRSLEERGLVTTLIELRKVLTRFRGCMSFERYGQLRLIVSQFSQLFDISYNITSRI